MAANGRSPVDSARLRWFRLVVAALVIAFLIFQVDSDVTATTWRRLLVASFTVAGVAVLGWAGACWPKYTRLGSTRYLGLASESDLPRSRKEILRLVRQESAARYGQAVLPHLARRARLARTGITAICGLILAYFVYANFSQNSLPPLIGLIVTFAACALILRRSRRETELALRAMEQAMGGHTMTASSTRWQPDEYVAWCLAHDIEPYPRGRPADTPSRGAII